MPIADDIKQSFKQGSVLTRLIYINLAVFIVITIIRVIFFLFNINTDFDITNLLAVPADLKSLGNKPWTVLTYMFTHKQFLHILFNLLTLYWFGTIFIQFLDSRKLLNLYLLGGIFGAAAFIAAFNVFPAFQQVLPGSGAIGASAAVMAIVIAIAVYVPEYTIYLFLIGQVKLKYIALVFIGLDILSLASGNAGGHFAHLGGALFGYVFAIRMKKGKDITKWFGKLLDGFVTLFKPRTRMKVTYKKKVSDFDYNLQKAKKQEEIDRILDKISKSGYGSLTGEEKDLLFKMGGKSN